MRRQNRMTCRMGISLNEIVPWGRTFNEYERMFALQAADLEKGVLDCGGGPASFTAEMHARGLKATSIDPLYRFSSAEIQGRYEAVEVPMLAQVRATVNDWVWTYHRDPDDLLQNRRSAIHLFLADYEPGRKDGRYLVAELPTLPFEAGSFGLALCSHLLFLYSDLLSQRFHLDAVRELCRVAREVRVFPLVTLRDGPSPHVDAVCTAAEQRGLKAQILPVDYELQRGGNQMLRISRP